MRFIIISIVILFGLINILILLNLIKYLHSQLSDIAETIRNLTLLERKINYLSGLFTNDNIRLNQITKQHESKNNIKVFGEEYF
jgi:hypothetical protein